MPNMIMYDVFLKLNISLDLWRCVAYYLLFAWFSTCFLKQEHIICIDGSSAQAGCRNQPSNMMPPACLADHLHERLRETCIPLYD
jgi:hypothetical protein